AGAEGMPLLFGREPVAEIAERLSRYRAIRAEAGVSDDGMHRETPERYVLRRIHVAETDAEALREVQEPLRWNREMAMRVHERGETIDTVPTLADGSTVETKDGEW